ncbi:hypothetical protein ANS017_11390 [Paraclostridium bifermentans]|uniref:peptidoglycan binding domain-containing protein n=1 Tax=Paraclostridium bifermentans TaxID=1490 RepID=UPI0021C3B1D5|nr:peptidoglycan binding domain-containing protein [Paraclostridium bifermentans]GKZ01798.1 hypothetical protein ANS014_02320 [Paraclostridium bifermentans]GKZ09755.1 hypothetical protein ANS017_11390 [Paraclostridium bifermentans]
MQQNVAVEEKKERVRLDITSKKNLSIIAAIILTLIIIASIGIKSFNNKYIYNGKIATNMYIGNVNVSDLTPNEAKVAVANEYKPKSIDVDYNDKNFIINPNQIDLKYDVNKFVDNAYKFNKTDSYFKNVERVIALQRGKKEVIAINPTYNEKKIRLSIR